MIQAISLRVATPSDAPKLLEIYAPYVRETAITFEYDVPTVEEFAQRIANTLQRYPYLVALEQDQVVGYAYASTFHARAAYDWAVETSIYVDRDRRQGGVGKKLYLALEALLREQQVTNSNACITYPNPGSIAFHQHLGYQTVGHFTKCGYKMGQWYDMIWMEKHLMDHPPVPAPFCPFPTLSQERVLAILNDFTGEGK